VILFQIELFINLIVLGLISIQTEIFVSQKQQPEGIDLIITNIRNKNGLIQIGMYDSDKGYPNKPEVSFSFKKDSLTSGTLKLFLPVKKPGTYAISILDDENMNEKMDYRLGILPKEGFAFSNNPKIRGMKEPPFEVTRFFYGGGRMVLTVRMVYI
jgi:uncharacterized protein (DUF2141 family)